MLASINPLRFYQDFGLHLFQNASKYKIDTYHVDHRFIKVTAGDTFKIIRMQDWFYAPDKTILLNTSLKEFEVKEKKKNGNEDKGDKSRRIKSNDKQSSTRHVRGSDNSNADSKPVQAVVENGKQGETGSDMETVETSEPLSNGKDKLPGRIAIPVTIKAEEQ